MKNILFHAHAKRRVRQNRYRQPMILSASNQRVPNVDMRCQDQIAGWQLRRSLSRCHAFEPRQQGRTVKQGFVSEVGFWQDHTAALLQVAAEQDFCRPRDPTFQHEPRLAERLFDFRHDPLPELESQVMRKLNAAKGGGFIVQSDHSVPSNVSAERYEFVLNLVRRHGHYPLRLGAHDIPDLG